LCDGSEVSVVVYSMLYEVIGENYKPNPADGYFGLPDLRGRFTLGADNMGGNFASVVDDLAASIVGAKGGSDTTIIQTNNLPEHKHDLRGDSGDQFYVLRDVSGTPNDDNAIIYDAPTGTGVGQALSDSGGVVSDTAINQPLNTMNPFMTVNYIIYAGEG